MSIEHGQFSTSANFAADLVLIVDADRRDRTPKGGSGGGGNSTVMVTANPLPLQAGMTDAQI
jgi:hypothetical protein